LPAGFRFGVATSGFQTEGGFNGPGEPANNWASWERAGRVEPSGIALDFWRDYEHHLERAAALGCDAFRLSVEWARCEPAPGEIDHSALAHYARILAACRMRGLEPLVTLHHFTHPAWLGPDFWLALDAPERFVEWVRTAVIALCAHNRQWVTLNEINVVALQTYMAGGFPPGRRLDTGAVVRTLDHMLAAHVLAYETIHSIQPDAVVGTNNDALSVYEFDRLLTDALLARRNGVERHGVGGWLAWRRADFYRGLVGRTRRERWFRRAAASIIPLDRALPRALAAVYASRYDRCLDVTQIDFYDPWIDAKLRLPGHRSAGGRVWYPGRMLWDDRPDPALLADWCGLAQAPGMDVWIVENGLCSRVRRGVSHPRADGWDRVRYLRRNVGAVVAALERGLPVGAYYVWSLADNYEWGSYEPRFGIYGVDRERGVRWSQLDSMGADSAGAYRAVIEGLRAGDASVCAL